MARGYSTNRPDVPLDVIKSEPVLIDLFKQEFASFFDLYDYGMELLQDKENKQSTSANLRSIIDNL